MSTLESERCVYRTKGDRRFLQEEYKRKGKEKKERKIKRERAEGRKRDAPEESEEEDIK